MEELTASDSDCAVATSSDWRSKYRFMEKKQVENNRVNFLNFLIVFIPFFADTYIYHTMSTSYINMMFMYNLSRLI